MFRVKILKSIFEHGAWSMDLIIPSAKGHFFAL